MKLSQWAKQQGITYVTAFNWFKSGKLPVPAIQTETGTILIQEPQQINTVPRTVIYARVSSHNKKEDLERQVDRCIEFCTKNGWSIDKIYKEIASGMNDSRKRLTELFNSNPTRIVVEHKDRLTRFGFNYIQYFLNKQNCELIVINKDYEEKNDLIKDLVAIITSFCCRLYGLRRSKEKVDKIKTIIK